MEQEEIWIPTIPKTPSTVCRICVLSDDEDNANSTPMIEQYGVNSLRTMLETLFPSVFNDEQFRNDLTSNWPSRICLHCKHKVLDAFSLYELCVSSADRLRNLFTQEGTSVSDAGNISDTHFVLDLPEGSLPNPLEEISRHAVKKGNASEISPKGQEVPGRTALKRLCRVSGMKREVASPINDEIEALRSEKLQKNFKQPKRSLCERQKKIQNGNNSQLEIDEKHRDDGQELAELKDLHRCQLCEGLTFTSPTDLTDHLKSEHPDQIRCCEQCSKVFVSEKAFQQHEYCHATGRSHFCMFCDKGFQKQNLLESHMKTHTERSDFLCSLCGKEFTNHTNLRQHAKIKHSGEKPWACALCPSRFTTKGSLKMHQYTHTKVKKFSCESCGTQFTKHSSLVKHRLIHTGERPFVCEVCKMRFLSNYMLKRHMLTHTGEKPFKCTYCESRFTQSNDMVKHIRSHVGKNLYKCDRCHESYRLLSELRNHYTEHYRSGDASVTTEEDKNIRFTTTYIMKLRMEREMAITEGSRTVEVNSIS